MKPYINLRYSDSKIIIDYYFAKLISATYRSGGITSTLKNLKEVKENILKFTKSSPEKEIKIKSRVKSLLGGTPSKYSKIEKDKLQRLTNYLNKTQKDITFKLAA